MTELSFAETPPRAELIDRIQAELGSLGVSLRVVARDLLGADARIDLVASDPDGRLTLLLIGGEPDDLALVALGLAQRAWVEARLPDWIQLAPQLGLRADGPVRVVLVAPRFGATAEAAVRAAGGDDFDLVTYRCVQPGRNGNAGPVQVLLEATRMGGAPPGPMTAGSPPPASRFRTGLSDADLMVSSEEKRRLSRDPLGGDPR